MQYAILIYGDEKQAEKMTPADGEKVMAAYFEYTQALEKSGAHKGGVPLQPTTTASQTQTTIKDVGGVLGFHIVQPIFAGIAANFKVDFFFNARVM